MVSHCVFLATSVDVFCEMGGENYIYQVVPVAIQAKFKLPRKWEVTCDWNGILSKYLSQGWRLAEIFTESGQSGVGGMTSSRTIVLNSCWIFEKPTSRADDNSPVYEGTMLEYGVELTYEYKAMGLGGVVVTSHAEWEPTIREMGKKGWELVRILPTPDTRVEGTMKPKITMIMWMFFQRKLVIGKLNDTFRNMGDSYYM
jgi:hypothetical protein